MTMRLMYDSIEGPSSSLSMIMDTVTLSGGPTRKEGR
jgi:hypothetical protein